jgi:hypothetical protein
MFVILLTILFKLIMTLYNTYKKITITVENGLLYMRVTKIVFFTEKFSHYIE